jgi:uncharacterized repeat protein (TIGR01451 family)
MKNETSAVRALVGCTGFLAGLWLAAPASAQVNYWSGWTTVSNAVVGDGTVAVCQFARPGNNRLILLARGSDSKIHHSYFDGRVWISQPDLSGEVLTGLSPCVAVNNHSAPPDVVLSVFIVQNSDRKIHVKQYNGTTWTAWSPVPGGQTTDKVVSAAADYNGQVYLFAKGSAPDQRIYFTRLDGTWLPVPAGGLPDVLTDDAPAATAAIWPKRVKVFARRTGDGGIMENTLGDDGTTWSGWSQVPSHTPPLTTDAAPAAANFDIGSVYDGYPYLIMQGHSDQVIYANWYNGTAWDGWYQVPGDGIADAPLSAARYENDLYLFAKSFDGHLLVNVGNYRPNFGLVDVIPREQSYEWEHDSEPSVAVLRGPDDTWERAVVSSTTPTNQAFFKATDGGRTWSKHQGFSSAFHTTLAMSPGGRAYAAQELLGPGPLSTIWTLRSDDFMSWGGGGSSHSGVPEQQPWLELASVGGLNRLYVGFNDLNSAPGSTASIRYSLDGDAVWTTAIIEKSMPAGGADSPAVRVAAAKDGHTVYALFARYGDLSGADRFADIVLVCDTNGLLPDFSALGNGTIVAHVVVPVNATTLGFEKIGSDLSLAVSPNDPFKVYIAYVEVAGGLPRLRVRTSKDGGLTFDPNIYSPAVAAALPALAVAVDDTVGLLYTARNGANLETHFLHAIGGRFLPIFITDRTMATSTLGDSNPTTHVFVGRYQDLKAVDRIFYGVFSAWNHPDLGRFPRGVRFQRDIQTPLHGSPYLWSDFSGFVRESLDPFYFYERISQPTLAISPYPAGLPGGIRLNWAEGRGLLSPLFIPEVTHAMSSQAAWTPVTNAIVRTNGEFSVQIAASGSTAFYRLRRQPPPGMSFVVTASAGAAGNISPAGLQTKTSGGNLVFTALPGTNFIVSQWFVDGQIVQASGNTFSLDNIQDDHTVLVTFALSNDVSVAMGALPPDLSHPNQIALNQPLTYLIIAANNGLKPATGVTISDALPLSVTFVSVESSQGSCSTQNGTVVCQLGSLSNNASATVRITVLPHALGLLTNTVVISASEPDGDVSNNQATATIAVGLQPLVAAGSVWRYRDDGSNFGAVWSGQNYDDSNWKSGPAKLGYGEGDEATVVSYGPNPTNRYVTTYFRQSFLVDNPSDFASLLLRLKRDDGAIVYLNGAEVFRSNMPTGAVSSVTFAASQTVGADETNFFTTTLSSNLLVSGVNLLAVEVHQDSPTSDDLSFDLELDGYLASPQPPAILQQPQSRTCVEDSLGNSRPFRQ